MNQSPTTMPELLDRIVAWARDNPDIRAVLLAGSQARTHLPADEWSDLDLGVIVTDVEPYLSTTDWQKTLGTPWLTFLERSPSGSMERRVLYKGALDVDFNFFTAEQFRQFARDEEHGKEMVANIVRRGVRVLVDKDDIAACLPPVAGEKPVARRPDEADFLNVVHDFWYHAVWTAKKLRRGELFTAKSCCDGYMKRLLADMIACHARATHGWEYDTWHSGRFLDQWADPRAVVSLREAYAHYDAADIRRALFATMELFRWLAVETAERLGFSYPSAGDHHATQWVHACLADFVPPRPELGEGARG